MKLRILKYIIVSFFFSFLLSNIIFKITKSTPSAIEIYISFWTQFILSIINCFILFTNSKNYYYAGKILFYVPQFIGITILLMLDDYWKESISTWYVPFFIVQTLFYFKVKKMFSDLDN
jgi:hypothetical protein